MKVKFLISVVLIIISICSNAQFTVVADATMPPASNVWASCTQQPMFALKIKSTATAKITKLYVSYTGTIAPGKLHNVAILGLGSPNDSVPSMLSSNFNIVQNDSYYVYICVDVANANIGEYFYLRIDSVSGYDNYVPYTFTIPILSNKMTVVKKPAGTFWYNTNPSTRGTSNICVNSVDENIMSFYFFNVTGEDIDIEKIAISFHSNPYTPYCRMIDASCVKNITVIDAVGKTVGSGLVSIPGVASFNYKIPDNSLKVFYISLDVVGCVGKDFKLQIDSVIGRGINTKISYVCKNGAAYSMPMTIIDCSINDSVQTYPTGPGPNGISSNNNEKNTKFYPNPFSDHVTIVTETEKDFVVLDNAGRQVYAGSVYNSIDLPTNSWASGVYIVKFSDGSFQKLVKR